MVAHFICSFIPQRLFFVVGLVQVKTTEGTIYLFRTGRNDRLMVQGRLGELLESNSILKIMHACCGDILSVYKENVAMWKVYDTALAYNMVMYQKEGR